MSTSSFHKQRPVHEPGNRIERRRDKIHVQSRPFFIENGTLYESILKLTLSLLEVIDM